MSSVPEINLPNEECHSFGVFLFCLSAYIPENNMYIYTDLLIPRVIGGSAEQPPLGPKEKAQESQPKPHPSNKTV